MATPGRLVLDVLRNRLVRVRDEAARVHSDYGEIDRRMDEYVSRRGEAIVELAKHDLPDISQASIERSFAEIRNDLQAILARKERAHGELEGRLNRHRAAINDLEQQIAAKAEELNRLASRRGELEQQIAEQLQADAKFQQLTQTALQAEMQLKANEERAEELQLEAADKLPAYDRSRLFRYLHQRQFGTPEYPHRGWTRSMDRWVARLIEFERHRKGYEFLQKTPVLVKQEVEQRRTAFHALMEQVETIQKRVTDEAGLTKLLQAGSERGAEHDRLATRLDEEQGLAQQVQSELHNLDQQQGRFHAEALERYTRFLSETETSVLQARASQTSDPHDDEIVSRIAWLTGEIGRLKPDVDALADRSREAEQRTEGLSFVVRRAEQANLDSDRCTTDDLDAIESHLQSFLAGAMNPNDLWRGIQSRLRFAPTWVESAAVGAGEMLQHPATHVLLQALTETASTALQQSAQRSVQRRAQVQQNRRVQAESPRPRKGFTTRGGF